MRALTAGCLTGALNRAGLGRLRSNPYALQGQVTSLQQQQAALTQRNQELQSKTATLDQDNQDLQTQLARNQRQSKLLQDQVTVLREQLGSTTTQLVQAQQDKQLAETQRSNNRRLGQVAAWERPSRPTTAWPRTFQCSTFQASKCARMAMWCGSSSRPIDSSSRARPTSRSTLPP